jgi:Cu/Ag efflux protein CusF
MKHPMRNVMAALFATLVVTACGERTPTENAPTADSQTMPAMETQPSPTEDANPSMPEAMHDQMSRSADDHTAQGTVNSVDAANGTVNISHGAVASAGWPAMRMDFKLADPKMATGLTAGQHVVFRFTTGSNGHATVTHIMPAKATTP